MNELWSQDDLDRALSALHDDVHTDDTELEHGRTALLVAATTTTTTTGADRLHAVPPAGRPVATRPRSARGRPRVSRRWVAVAASVATLVAGSAVVQAVTMDQGTPGSAALALDLNSVAARVGTVPLAAGQFRYVDQHAWTNTTVPLSKGPLRYLAETSQQTWIPASETATWLQRRDVTGRRKWIIGSEAAARKIKYPSGSKIPGPFWVPETQRGTWTARCGEFFGIGAPTPQGTCPGGSWQTPTQAWIAQQSRDPYKLLASLRAESIKNGRGDVEVLNTAVYALESGRLPGDLQAAVFRALALVPGLTVTTGVANADGRVGVGYGIEDKRTRFQLILDPKTGEFIGRREVIIANGDLEGPRGTLLGITAVTAKVVGALGSR